MFRYSISFQAIVFMVVTFIAYWIAHTIIREPNASVSFLTIIIIFVLGGIAGACIAVIVIRAKEEKEEEKK
jgi:prolipoprotein diacylglyceryltransferase